MKIATEHAKYHLARELGGLEFLEATYHRQCFSRHSHESYTIGVIEDGAQRFLRNGSNHIAPRDSIILVNHEEVHDGQAASQGGWSYKAIYPSATQLAQATATTDVAGLSPVHFPEPVVQDPELANLFRLALQSLRQSDNLLLRETLLYAAILQLVQRHGRILQKPPEAAEAQSKLQRVKQRLDDCPEENISLESLSELAGVSTYHLLRQFQKFYGLPPHAYQIQARIKLSKRLIKSGDSLLNAAMKSGFHDQSHFSRHFKRAIGITPGNYAQQFINT